MDPSPQIYEFSLSWNFQDGRRVAGFWLSSCLIVSAGGFFVENWARNKLEYHQVWYSYALEIKDESFLHVQCTHRY